MLTSWLLMLLSDFIIPVTMIGMGLLLEKRPPKEINGVFGYRTSQSMKSKDTWEFAQKYCGRIWHVCGRIMLPVTAIAMLFVFGKNEDVICTAGLIICAVQFVFLIGSIVPVERALKKNFDYYGFRKK